MSGAGAISTEFRTREHPNGRAARALGSRAPSGQSFRFGTASSAPAKPGGAVSNEVPACHPSGLADIRAGG